MKIGKDTFKYVQLGASLLGAKGVAKAAGTADKIHNPSPSNASNGAKYTDFFSTDNDGPV